MKTFQDNRSGQSLLELALLMPILMVFVFGIVDFTRALYDYEVITNLAGEGSAAASREQPTYFAQTVTAIMADADINMNTNGCVIITSVSAGATSGYQVTAQAKSSPCNSTGSKIGCYPPPSSCGSATIPTLVQQVLYQASNNPHSSTTYVAATEVYFNFTPITPVGYFLHNSSLLPTQLYAVAYY
jgi:Flp pilus assembly protein TadG